VQLDRPKTNQSNRHRVRPASMFVNGTSIWKNWKRTWMGSWPERTCKANLKFARSLSGFSQASHL